MRIVLDKNKSTKWKIILCAIMFIFGIYIIISLALTSVETVEYQTIYGNYNSYQIKKTANYSGFTKNVYLTIEMPNSSNCEYRISSVVLSSFEEKAFLDEVNIGDPIKLTLDDDYIVSIDANGKSYLDFEYALSEYHDNLIVGYCVGCAFLLVSVIAFSTLITIKKGKHYRKS